MIVIGGTVREAQKYCEDKGLGMGAAVIVDHPRHLYGRHKPKVTLVGSFHTRKDRHEFLSALASRQAIVENANWTGMEP